MQNKTSHKPDHERIKSVLITSDQGIVFFCNVPQTEKIQPILRHARQAIQSKTGTKGALHKIKYYKNAEIREYIREYGDIQDQAIIRNYKIPNEEYLKYEK